MLEKKLIILTELCNPIYLHSGLKPVIIHCSGMAWTLEVHFQIFAASCCAFWVTTFEWRVESLVALQRVFLELVVVFHCKNFSFLSGLLADVHAGVQLASSVLKGSIDLSNIAVINLFSCPPQSHFHAFCIPSGILQTVCKFILIYAVVQSVLKIKKIK